MSEDAKGASPEEVVDGQAPPTTAPAGDSVPDESAGEQAAGESAAEQAIEAEQQAVAEQQPATEQPTAEQPAAGQGLHPDTALAAERLQDLQRLQAEYVNYKRRVDRDRAQVQERAVQDVLEALLPVLDDIHAAREHGDLASGPFASIADKLEQTLGRFGLTRFGDAGEPFDPSLHEALMHTQADLPEGAESTTVVTVLQPGYRAGDTVIRPARVAVADPQ